MSVLTLFIFSRRDIDYHLPSLYVRFIQHLLLLNITLSPKGMDKINHVKVQIQ